MKRIRSYSEGKGCGAIQKFTYHHCLPHLRRGLSSPPTASRKPKISRPFSNEITRVIVFNVSAVTLKPTIKLIYPYLEWKKRYQPGHFCQEHKQRQALDSPLLELPALPAISIYVQTQILIQIQVQIQLQIQSAICKSLKLCLQSVEHYSVYQTIQACLQLAETY